MSTRNKILLFFIIVTAIFLRFYNLKYIEFNFDQAANPLLAEQIIKHGPLPQNCLLSSIGVCNPFFFLYLLVPPLLISPDPLFLTGFIALINVFAVLLLFFFVRKFFNETAALISSALLAVNPWAIIFSRTIWQQNVLIFFTILFFWFLFNFAFANKKTHLIWAFLFLGIVSQLHQIGLLLGLILLVCLIVFRRNVVFKNIIMGIFLCFLLYLPFLIFEAKNNWYSINSITGYLQQEASFQPRALILPFQMLATRGLNYTLGYDYTTFLKTTLNWPIVDYLIIIFFLASLIYLSFKATTKNVLLLLWFLLLPLVLIFSKTTVYQHYFVVGLPASFIIFSIMVTDYYQQRMAKKGILKIILITAILLIILYQAIISFSYLNFLPKKKCVGGNHSQPYIYKLYNIEQQLKNGETMPEIIHKKICSCYSCELMSTQYILEKVIKINH